MLQTRLLEKLQRQNSEGSDTSKSETSFQISTSKSEPTFESSVTKPDTFATKNGTTLTATTTNRDANDSSRATHTGQQFPQFKATNILQVNHCSKYGMTYYQYPPRKH